MKNANLATHLLCLGDCGVVDLREEDGSELWVAEVGVTLSGVILEH